MTRQWAHRVDTYVWCDVRCKCGVIRNKVTPTHSRARQASKTSKQDKSGRTEPPNRREGPISRDQRSEERIYSFENTTILSTDFNWFRRRTCIMYIEPELSRLKICIGGKEGLEVGMRRFGNPSRKGAAGLIGHATRLI
jgi:hypothetical protein